MSDLNPHASVLTPSVPLPSSSIPIAGPDFSKAEIGLYELLESYERIGFQATGLGRAVEIVEKMVSTTGNVVDP